MGDIAIIGRFLDRPAPLEFWKDGALLKAQAKGAAANMDKALSERERFTIFVGLIPKGEDAALSQTAIVRLWTDKGYAKHEGEGFAKQAREQGVASFKIGPRNSMLMWLDNTMYESEVDEI